MTTGPGLRSVGHVERDLVRTRLGGPPIAITMQVPDVPRDQFEAFRRISLDEFALDPPLRVAPLAANFHDLHAKLLATEQDPTRLHELTPLFGLWS